jgi:hypothetical protein
MIFTWMDLPLHICGEQRHAKTDVCIMDVAQDCCLLLVQEDKRLGDREPINAHAQLVAEAVAAFNWSNAQREAAGHPPLADRVSHLNHFMSLLTLF